MQLILLEILNVPMTYNNKPFIDMFFKEIYPLYVKKYSYLKQLADTHVY